VPNVIIPSAVRVGSEIEVDFGPIPPCLVPIAGRVAAERVIEKYSEDSHFYIAIHDQGDLVREHFAFFPNDRVHLVDVGKTISIAQTLEKVFSAHPELESGPFILNFADTIVEDLDLTRPEGDFIVYAQTIESQRWTLVKETEGRIVELSDKEFQLDPTEWMMLLGVWGFSDGGAYLRALQERNPESNRFAFYEAMVDYYNALAEPADYIESKEYIDCGHADNYYAARRRLINARFFNSLEFNEAAGTIRKTSDNKEKLVDEIRWLQAIPKELRTYTPTIFDYSRDPMEPFLEMEFYSYPSLDEAFVSARFDFDAWGKLFSKLFGLIRVASKYTVDDSHLHDDLKEMYLNKTRLRISQVGFGHLEEKIHINGKAVNGLRQVQEQLEGALERKGALETPRFQVVHGDLCLGNILYDAKHGLIKLIDARGRFGRFDIYGDVYYDLAKLSHSILGKYDFIVSGRSRVIADGSSYELRFKSSVYHETVGAIFRQYLEREGYDLGRVRLIESLLFLSMVPLHRDYPDRQLAMLLQGLTLFNEFGATD
jgi:hypothetical protein